LLFISFNYKRRQGMQLPPQLMFLLLRASTIEAFEERPNHLGITKLAQRSYRQEAATMSHA